MGIAFVPLVLIAAALLYVAQYDFIGCWRAERESAIAAGERFPWRDFLIDCALRVVIVLAAICVAALAVVS
ncbi:MAG: hypothetical protein KF826_15740 [Xanthobacteraceae bacterium]|nr:hypothetical protein [Xanthobacteraceae bacterium]MCW5678416.1 hypothetical protein [Xanthobacteraceae bacterium]